MKTVALAGVLGLAATLMAMALLSFGGAASAALEWSVYDRWLTRSPRPASPALLIVARDPASEALFGPGVWDRAVIARLITSLTRAGATVVGVDVALGQPGAPGRGGAASDALLSQATAQAERVVFPVALERAAPGSAARSDGAPAVEHRAWPPLSPASPAFPAARPLAPSLPRLAQHARSIGHMLTSADPDGVVRRVPLFVRLGDRGVPAYGLALATTAAAVALEPIPVDRQGRMLIRFADLGPPGNSLAQVWAAIEERRTEALQQLVTGRIVLVLVEPRQGLAGTPLGPMSEPMIQAHVLNTVLTGSWLTEASPVWTAIGALLLAGVTAWLWLALRWWKASLGAGALALAYAAGLLLSPALFGLLLPLSVPLLAVIAASAGALVWSQLGSRSRIHHLEAEVAAVREALVLQESSVEALEEDLEATRAAVARSTGAEDALRAELSTARAQEAATRARLESLERRSRAPGTPEGRPILPGDVELERLQRESNRLGIVTRDPALLIAFGDLEKAARSTLPILITGEPGTGKELFARAVHHLGPRADRPFVAVNMAAIPAELFESELFGHVRGSFTGAVADRKGLFEQAHHGTIFLDEVGELRAEHQSKLLRVLQDRSFYRVGATRPTTVDVRVVAASNRALERGIREGWFREDLYFRLKGLVLQLPPLRERRHDIALLATHFATEAARELGRPSLPLSEAALAALARRDWPGNARELQNCLRQALALADGAVIDVDDLRLPAREPARDEADTDASVLASLRQHAFDMQATARALGWDRSTVTQRLKGLGFRTLIESDGDRARAALALAGDPALGRTVELKLREYDEHLRRAVAGFASVEEAMAACRRRFKNLPERYFRFLELRVRQHFERRSPAAGG